MEPQRCHTGADGLRKTAEHEAGGHGFCAGVQSEVEGQSHGEAFGYVVDEEGEEDCDAEFGVGVVGGVGDEAFG